MEHFYSGEEDPVAVTLDAGVKTAFFNIPVQDGWKYFLTLTARDANGSSGEPVNYFGVLTDTYSASFDGETRMEGAGAGNFTNPTAGDWMKVTISKGLSH